MNKYKDNMVLLYFSTTSDAFQSVLSIMIAIVLTSFVLMHVYVHCRYQSNIDAKKEAIEERFQPLYKDLRIT